MAHEHMNGASLDARGRARLLIAERGTDWLRALRSLSLAHRPFTTVVQANDDHEFLRERPWQDAAPQEIVLLCGPELSAESLESRLALFRHVASAPHEITVRIVADTDDGALANEALLEVLRSMAPSLPVRVTSLAALAVEATSSLAAARDGRRITRPLPDRRAA